MESQFDCPVFKFNTIPAARMNAKQVAEFLGFQPADIPILIKSGLKPLGNPVANAPKYFAWAEVVRRARDEDWLKQATRAVYKYWQGKNARKKTLAANGVQSFSE